MKAVQDRLKDLQELTHRLDLKETVFAIDEADPGHDLEKVLAMLTTSREIFFSSDKYTSPYTMIVVYHLDCRTGGVTHVS